MPKLGKLERVNIRTVWKKEDKDFTPWLSEEESIQLLGEAIGLDLEFKSLEHRIGKYSADIYCVEQHSDKGVVIENQYGSSDHDHLGKLITYAAGLSAGTIIWISEHIGEEHRAAVDWLNEISSKDVSFIGLELVIYKIGDSAPAPHFKVVSKPNDWAKSIKQQSKGILSDAQKRNLSYWTSFREYVNNTENEFDFGSRKPKTDNWYGVALGKTGYTVYFIINSSDKYTKIQFAIGVGDHEENMSVFDALKKEYEEALQQLIVGHDIIWDHDENRKEQQVNVYFKDLDPTDESQWETQHESMCKVANKFIPFWKSIVQQL